ncbi:MAG: dTMP kinase [Gemmatimonadaceae bacterium]|jgi:dTMP kinase|nr:dTMP kinase [Gemmatimonadaceae bacterium]
MIGGPVARPGALIAIDGIEGSGKSTLVAGLAARLRAYGREVVTLREPGGTQLGDRIRALLLDTEVAPAPSTEALLFIASRAELVAQHIAPALAEGKIVLVDRFMLSTVAYQVGGRGLPEDVVLASNQLALGLLLPRISFILDVPFEEGMRRMRERGTLDRMEREGEAFHRRVFDEFQKMIDWDWQNVHPDCGQIVRLDGMLPREEIVEEAWQNLSLFDVIEYRPVLSTQ